MRGEREGARGAKNSRKCEVSSSVSGAARRRVSKGVSVKEGEGTSGRQPG